MVGFSAFIPAVEIESHADLITKLPAHKNPEVLQPAFTESLSFQLVPALFTISVWDCFWLSWHTP